MLHDPVNDVVVIVRDALAAWWHPDQNPLGGGTTTVHLLAGDIVPLAMWDAHSAGGQNCREPFAWVRMMQRFRTKQFPAQSIDTGPCTGTPVAAIEVGVGRCATLGETIDWKAVDNEAAISREDSRRLELMLCGTAKKLQDDLTAQVGIDTLNPYGPEGGVTAWTGILFVSY